MGAGGIQGSSKVAWLNGLKLSSQYSCEYFNHGKHTYHRDDDQQGGGAVARGPPQFLKKNAPRMQRQMKIFMWVPINSGNRSGSCSKNCCFRIAQAVRGHSENGISHSKNYFLNSKSCSENTPELSRSSENGLFTPRAFFLKLGWSPGFLSTSRSFSKSTQYQ